MAVFVALVVALVVGSAVGTSWAWPADAPSPRVARSGVDMLPRDSQPPVPRPDSVADVAAGQAQARTPAASPTRPVGASAAWAWPVPEPREVVRGFDAPGAPWGAGHRGVDLRTVVGAPVLSPTDGVVTFAGLIAGREVLVVAHPGGLRSTFEPVSATQPVGTAVARGDAVGTLTSSPGHCPPGTCLHWGVLRGAVYLDPLAFVRQQVVLLPLRAPP